ncbi:MAG TPA: hypothetical protein VGM18_04570 [Candidatus Sulfotelmatobacter sp.]|jgi:hypothetical protein
MLSSINSLTFAQPAAAAPPAPAKASAQPIPVDTVQISSAAKALSQEALETPAQTAKEAAAGDPQAIRLLAKHQHAQKTST